MKKFGKFIFGTLSIATVAAGAYYLYKNFIKKDTTDDFDDFEDDFEDFDIDDEDDMDSREYVSINITSDEEEVSAEPETQDDVDASEEEK
ncbi:DNA-directed RNA polymerase subunit delta [Mobilitalea sibirica]|uniref:DNA-directed RNA polymerase subunit delta n=1 Tax=Mobilitalea sibirica TaxID=1462919 RepID=A0A8J7KZ35_9FIRM|nr:DNA-directed RNA polymerase subunit delta [Mobilitalea sibirica]MBH1939273.1 DNA-directed RNA polymerase subunit delta [Mobilitalea sibirica]